MADGQTKVVEVPGIGNVEFPASMADKDIGGAIQKHLLSDESYQAAHPPSAKPMAMQSDSPAMAAAVNVAANQKAPTIEQMSQSNRDAANFGAEAIGGQELFRPVAALAESHVLPALKSIPYAGKVINAIDEAPGTVGKVVRGATVGGAVGGTEGLIRGHGAGSLKDAAEGAAMGGAAGAILPAIHKFSGYEPPRFVDPGAPLPSTDEFYANRGAEINRAMKLQPDAFSPPAPEPELGSPENPGFMSKLPARLPKNLHSDPFAPPETAEASRQAEASTEPNPNKVAIVPDERPALPSDRRGFAYSLTRTKGLPEAAQRGQPGAIDVLRQIQPTVVTPRSGGFETPNMQALRDSLGISESFPKGNADPFAPAPPDVPQGNATPYSPPNSIVPDRSINPEVQMPLRVTDNQTGVTHSIHPDDMDSAANALFGKEKYSDLTPAEKESFLKFGQGPTKAARTKSPFYQALDNPPIDIPQGNPSPFEPSQSTVTNGWLTPRKRDLR